jgi:hypothetical protein
MAGMRVGHAVGHQKGIALIEDQRREPVSNAHATLGGGEQHHAAVGGETSTIEGSGEFFPGDGWKAERLDRIVGHGGCGSECSCGPDGFDTQSVSSINALRVQFIDIVSPEQIGCGLDGQRCALPTNPTAPASPTPN